MLGFEQEKILCIPALVRGAGRLHDPPLRRLAYVFSTALTEAGRWHKQLDSAEERWGGPGSLVGLAVASEGEVTLPLPPESCLLFAHTAES